MSGQEGELSPSQERTLAQTPGTGPQDSTTTDCPLVAARSFDLEKSNDMLRKHVKFRKQQDLHNILAWQPSEVVRLYNANGICGHDSEGSPVWYRIIRGLDLRGLLLSVSRQELLRAEFQSCELLLQECEQQSQECPGLRPGPTSGGVWGPLTLMGVSLPIIPLHLGKKVEKIIAVFDFEGLSQRHLWKPGVEFAQEFLTALEANYPEMLKNIIVVRASKLFPVAFNLIKPYITEEMRRKVVIPGDNWKQELPKFISPDQLPVEFGGIMADPDGNPKCLTKVQVPRGWGGRGDGHGLVPTHPPSPRINYGGKVPRSYYLCNQVRVQYEHQVTVGRGSSLQVENEILFPGCVLRWQFSSDEADIGFGVFLKTKTGERQRHNTHLVPEGGSLTCLQAGVCKIYWVHWSHFPPHGGEMI
ncbi:hypothetical protein E2I00_010019 [Balaenoptera physalus]|uniref:CRAL-TRIO domain-containing protein n=1 Tax=Balaenoptera physalus TaxID=9770 RepID=A0A6A1QG23_BALPH|nr:hypothetical protein E2I00_010019 [Balaenoptera physalus]